MTTFKQFILESDGQLSNIIEDKCSYFLNESHRSGLLYRGLEWERAAANGTASIGGTQIEYGIFNVRKDRQSYSTREDIHYAYNGYFEKRFGWKARSESVFVTGDWGMSTLYGFESAMVFPIGKFKYVWSPKVKDIIKFGHHLLDTETDKLKSQDQVIELMDDLSYQSGDLQAAIRSGNEIMIGCDQFLAVRFNEHRRKLQTGLVKTTLDIK